MWSGGVELAFSSVDLATYKGDRCTAPRCGIAAGDVVIGELALEHLSKWLVVGAKRLALGKHVAVTIDMALQNYNAVVGRELHGLAA